MSTPAVRYDRVCKARDERAVLDDVSLTVHQGETFVIVGPQGAGKSSLLRVAAGLQVISGGRVEVHGRDARRARTCAQAPVLAIFDDELAEAATARESVELHVRAGAVDGAGVTDAALKEAGLHEQAGTVVGELTRGQRRRLAIACALAQEPALLLLDEPTAGLAAVERDELWGVVAGLRERGSTTLLATTSLQEAISVGDRAALIIGGALQAVGDPAQIAIDFFAVRSLHFHVVEKPDRALLEDLPEIRAVEIDERADHWAVELVTAQPGELLALLQADPDFPQALNVDEEQLVDPLASGQQA